MTWSQLKQLAISSCRRRPSDLNALGMQFSIDVSILYAQDGAEWADYLQESVQTVLSPRIVNINCVKLGSSSNSGSTTPLSPISRAIRSSKVLLIILSQELLNFVLSVNFVEVGKLMDGGRTLAMLCGIRADQLSDAHLAQLPASKSWHQMEARSQDKHFALDLISTLCEQLRRVNDSVQASKPKFKLTPRKVVDANSKVFLLLEQPVTSTQKVAVTLDSKEVPAKVRNPFTVQFVMPHQYLTSSKVVHVQLTVDGECQGARPIKCESRLGELNALLQASVSPFENLRLTLGVPTVHEVDAALATAFVENLPSEGFQFLTPGKLVEERRKSESNLPTLLHFAAQYGLKDLAAVLLKCPGALSCCQLLNLKGQSPATVATQAGHPEVASLIDEWMSSQSALNRLSTLSRATSIYHHHQHHHKTPVSSAECSPRSSGGLSSIPGYENAEVLSRALHNVCDSTAINANNNNNNSHNVHSNNNINTHSSNHFTGGDVIDGIASGSEASTSQEQLPRAGSASDSGAHSDASDNEGASGGGGNGGSGSGGGSCSNRLSLPLPNPFPDYDMLPRPSRPNNLGVGLQKSMTLTRDARPPSSEPEDHVYYMYNGTKATRKSGCQTLTRGDYDARGSLTVTSPRACTSLSTLPSTNAQRARSGIYYDVPPMKPVAVSHLPPPPRQLDAARVKTPQSPPRLNSFKSPVSPSKTSLAEVLAEYDFPMSSASACVSPARKSAAGAAIPPPTMTTIAKGCSSSNSNIALSRATSSVVANCSQIAPTRCTKGDYYDLPRFNYGGVTDPNALQIPEVPAPPPPSK